MPASKCVISLFCVRFLFRVPCRASMCSMSFNLSVQCLSPSLFLYFIVLFITHTMALLLITPKSVSNFNSNFRRRIWFGTERPREIIVFNEWVNFVVILYFIALSSNGIVYIPNANKTKKLVKKLINVTNDHCPPVWFLFFVCRTESKRISFSHFSDILVITMQ